MAHTGVWARLALLLAALMLVCPCALADEATLQILSCEQQGEAVTLDFVCLNENNAPVNLPLQIENWTVRGADSVTDMQVTDVRSYQGGVHHVFVYEASSLVGREKLYTQMYCIEAMKACVDGLKAGDRMSVVQLGSQMKFILNGERDKAKMTDALAQLDKNSKAGTPLLYDQINEALAGLKRRDGERTVMFILSTGMDAGSKLTKFELAQRLEQERISVYPVLVSADRSVPNASGLEPLSVRGGFMLNAETVRNKDEMIAKLTAVLPVVRNAYTLTARPMDPSYNGQKDMTLRVFVRQGDDKISGQALLTTNDMLYRVIATPIPQPAVTAAPPAPTPIVTAVPSATAAPVVTAAPVAAPAAETQAPNEPVDDAEPNRSNAWVKYALWGGGALVTLLAVVFILLAATRKVRTTKAKKPTEERPAAINPQFGAMKAGEAPAAKAATPAKVEKPSQPVAKPAPVQAPQQPVNNPADFFNTPPVVGTEKAAVPAVAERPALSQPGWDATMDERQTYQKPASAAWDKTMDEHQAAQPAACDDTMDDRPAPAAVLQAPAWDKTMDERQARPASQQPVASAPVGPKLVLTITDAAGTREVAKPLMTGGEVTMGRENADILLDRHDHSISRQHLSIRLTASHLTVVDHSGNGTMVDGKMLRRGEAKLTIGSELKLGGLDEAAANRCTTVIRIKDFR